MKIVDVNPFFYPYRGGIERRMADTAQLLSAVGHEVTVVTGMLSDDAPAEEQLDGYRVIRLPSRRIKLYNPPFIMSSGIREVLASLDPDIVNFNYRWAPSYTRALRKYDGKKVFTYHNMWGEGIGWQHTFSEVNDNLFRGTFETFDHIIAVSKFVQDDLVQRGYSPRFVTTVPSCLSPGTPIIPGAGDGDFALSLGRLVRTKGLDVLIEAMKSVTGKLIICGKGPDESRLQRAIAAAGVGERVEMRGYVSEEEKQQLMASCRFFVIPSLHESLGLAAVELMAHGRPLVCSDADGLPETVGDCGLVVPKGDAAALAAAMNSLFADRARCEILAAAAAQRAAYYDWRHHLPTIEEVYRQVIAGTYSAADAHTAE